MIFYKVNPDYFLRDSFYPAAKLQKLIRKFRWHWIAKIKSKVFGLGEGGEYYYNC